MGSRIKDARQAREWSQGRLITEMERAAARRGDSLPSRDTLKGRVSRWENNHAVPDEFYRRLLREALGLDDVDLGFSQSADEQMAIAVEELRSHLVTDRAPDEALLEALAGQTEAIRRQDRQYGAASLLEQMRAHVANVEQHLSYATFDSTKRPLAGLLADAASLAAWQALDLGAIGQAWRFFETASRAARQALNAELYAFSRMEQAHVLLDLETRETAAALAVAVWRECGRRVAPSLRCWLAAATAEMQASAGENAAARQMIDVAESLVDGLAGERPPYLVFDRTHFERWVGHNLALMHDPAAEPLLRQVQADMDASFTRAGASLHLDLASALLDQEVADEARSEIARAESLARRVTSRRQLERARRLRAGV